jgi:hypothetical protein
MSDEPRSVTPAMRRQRQLAPIKSGLYVKAEHGLKPALASRASPRPEDAGDHAVWRRRKVCRTMPSPFAASSRSS